MEVLPEKASLVSSPEGGALADAVRRVAFDSPGLADLSPEHLNLLANAVIVDGLKDELRRRANLERIIYRAERSTFLEQAGRTGSPHTRQAYAYALDRLEAWALRVNVPVVEMKPGDADEFIYSLKAEGRAAASVNRDIAGASSFFGFLERRYEEIRNPFRGTKARPQRRPARAVAYPGEAEVQRIFSEAKSDPLLMAAIAVMAYRGLRVGALPSISIKEGRYSTRSKGKSISGALPTEAIYAIEMAGLDLRKPFGTVNARALAKRFHDLTARLAKAGQIGAAYSVHDLRHFFATEHYKENKDIYSLKELLGHASIQVTEVYLRGIGIL